MVVAAANRTKKLAPELLSRFQKFKIQEYSKTEFTTIVKNILIKREELDEYLATYIATYLVNNAEYDIREAVRIAGLVKYDDDPKMATSLIFQMKNKYR